MGAIRRSKTKRRTRDMDLVHADLQSPKHLSQHTQSRAVEDLPGLGQWYCVECAKWFEGEHNLIEHRRGKNHKRRVRLLRDTPYTQKEAEAAVGLGTDNGSRSHSAPHPKEDAEIHVDAEQAKKKELVTEAA
ncbi:MAG: Bud site selection protein 20 [Thelocarpon superellum]|nr:MAG: Bud site selection protein 20 [Thelocarpon superellum]